jgi:hypothetical protein
MWIVLLVVAGIAAYIYEKGSGLHEENFGIGYIEDSLGDGGGRVRVPAYGH